MYRIFILFFLISVNKGLLLRNDVKDAHNYYDVDNLNSPEERPMINYVKNSNKAESLSDVIKVTLPHQRDHDYELLLDKDNNIKNYVIIRSKQKIFDIGPYEMIRRLDEIKYMVLWLNLYCEMHPDCDKKILNEELKKVVSTAGKNPEIIYK